MTELTRKIPKGYRCDKCGMIRLVLDEPINLAESDEILRDEVWAVFRQGWAPGTKTFSYIDSLFYTEESAREEMKRQIRQASDSDGRTTRAGLYDGESWRFTDTGEEIFIAKVKIRL